MPNIFDLPNELLIEIINLVTPESIEQFTSCCKEIYNVGRDASKIHNRYRKQYGSITCAPLQEASDLPTGYIHPLRFLAEIARDERIVEYTTELIIDYKGYDPHEHVLNDNEREDLYKLHHLSYEAEQWICTKIKNSPILAGDLMLIEEWTMMVLSGFLGKTWALLLTLLPNLDSITSIDSLSTETEMFEMVSRINETFRQDYQDFPPALAKLTKIDIRDSQPLKIYEAFASLPSMRFLQGRQVIGDFFTWPCYWDPHTSGVTDLQWNETSIDIESLMEFLKGIRALESFTLTGDSQEEEWNPLGIINSLLLYAKESLRKLSLTYGKGEDSDNDCYFSAPLSPFEVLTWVRLDVESFFDVGISNVDVDEALPDRGFFKGRSEDYHYGYEARPLVDMLPASIETLELVGVLSEKNTASLLRKLPELKEERVPRLKKIVFEGHYMIDETLKTECERAGITLEHRQTSWYNNMKALGLHHHH